VVVADELAKARRSLGGLLGRIAQEHAWLREADEAALRSRRALDLAVMAGPGPEAGELLKRVRFLDREKIYRRRIARRRSRCDRCSPPLSHMAPR